MKKALIAGAASAVLAMLPAAGVFAADKPTVSISDKIVMTVSSTCTMTRTAAAGAASDGVTGETVADDSDATAQSGKTYSGTITGGASGVVGTSTFTLACNDQSNGYTLSVATTGLTAKQATTGIAEDQTIGYNSTSTLLSASSAAAQESGWQINIKNATGTSTTGLTTGILSVTDGTGYLIGSSSETYKANAFKGSFDAEYGVGVSQQQPAGTYTGTAVYTLTYGAAS